jgi:hypothetical protein
LAKGERFPASQLRRALTAGIIWRSLRQLVPHGPGYERENCRNPVERIEMVKADDPI